MSLDIYRLAFARVKGLRPDIAREILSRTGSEEAFMTLSEGQLRAMLGFDGKILGDAYRNGLLGDSGLSDERKREKRPKENIKMT